jgi:hypothetical protein
MLGRALADTGALLALLDADDAWHERCAIAFRELRLPLVTSAAVLTELFHLISEHEVTDTWGFVRSGALSVASIDDADLPELAMLMDRYSALPMDFADATLVRLAKREKIAAVFTIDHRDFATYRLEHGRRFRIVPER